jgi:hypothetical protein
MLIVGSENGRAVQGHRWGGPCLVAASERPFMQRASGRVALDIAGKGDDLSFLTFALRTGTCGGQASSR